MTETRNTSTAGPVRGSVSPWHVIVLNDDHNTFDVRRRRALARDRHLLLRRGHGFANRIHTTGQAVVWSGHREVAEHY